MRYRYVEPTPNIDPEQLELEVAREVGNLTELGTNLKVKKCKVCQDESTRIMVNRLLANMLPYVEVHKAVDLTVNPMRAKNQKISYDSVYNHAKSHFNVDEPAKALYRDMMERRAAEYAEQNKQAQVEGITNLLTAFGFLDVVAHKGYETLIDDDTRVPVQQGMDAVIKLHDMTKMTAREQENAELKQHLAIIQAAVKDVVPKEYWDEIIARIEDTEGRYAGARIVDAEVVEDEYADDEEPFAPMIETDDDDDLED